MESSGLPRSRIVIAHHLVFMGYGHWLPNDIRGSGSEEIRNPLLRELGEIHRGRKQIQPAKNELQAIHREAGDRLEDDVIWFDNRSRTTIANAFGEVAGSRGYTIWAGVILRNHAHLVLKRHKHRHDVMWRTFAEGSGQSLRVVAELSEHHRVWAERPYSRFLYSPDEVRVCIRYVENNPTKEGLPEQGWDFVEPYPV